MNRAPRELYAVAQVRELDRRATASGIPGYQLMQHAAAACWREIARRWPMAQYIHVICGSGNNGGDGYEIARLALAAGCQVKVWQVSAAAPTGDAVIARQAWLTQGGTIAATGSADFSAPDVVVDAVFGIGLSRALEGEILTVIEDINRARKAGAKVLAVDVPSGLNADTGTVLGAAVQADVTVTFIGAKPGLYTASGKECAGEVVVCDLGIPEGAYKDIESSATLMRVEDLVLSLTRRDRNAHKGHNGHVLLIGGNHGMGGAILLAARAALCAGGGLVTVATRAQYAGVLTSAQPELMCRALETQTDLFALIQCADVIAIGPGLGQDAWARELLGRVLQSKLPLVLDADALNLLAQEPSRCEHWVLTPHPGEAARLLDTSTADIQSQRPTAALQLQQRYGGVIVLKGAGTWVQSATQAQLCPYGNPGMAVGGMGDALTGIIAAFIAQGLTLEQAAASGVLAHALAGDRAAQKGERGLLPSDLIVELRAVVNP